MDGLWRVPTRSLMAWEHEFCSNQARNVRYTVPKLASFSVEGGWFPLAIVSGATLRQTRTHNAQPWSKIFEGYHVDSPTEFAAK